MKTQKMSTLALKKARPHIQTKGVEPVKRSERKAFWGSFGISFLTLTLTAVTVVFALVPSSELSADATAKSYEPDSRDALTVLFAGGSKDSFPTDCLLVRLDPVAEKIRVLILSPYLMVQGDSGWDTLGSVCRDRGMAPAAQALSTTLEVPVDRYLRMDAEAFTSVADLAGSVEYQLPFDITLAGGVRVQKGRQQMDGRKLTALIQYQTYEQGESQRRLLLSGLAVTAINQRIDIVSGPVGEAVFKMAVNLSDTDISYADFERSRAALRHLAALEYGCAESVLIEEQAWPWHEGVFLTPDAAAAVINAFGAPG
jgi:hypothetical protein